MGLGLTLTANIGRERRSRPALRDWLSRAATWFEAVGDAVLDTTLDRDREGRPHLRIHCHPAAEPISLKLHRSGRLKLVARTTPAGPGFHRHLCTLFEAFARDFEFSWEPPPGDHDPGCYFVNRDHARLEKLFDHWLSSRCQQVLAKVREGGGPYAVGLNRGAKYLHPGPVLTPLGPKPLDWLKRMAAEETADADFFAWSKPELNAEFFNGRALAALWLDFPFRAPESDDEGERLDQIASDLANALDLDETVNLPWNAWREVIAAIEADRGRFSVEPISAELKALVEGMARPGGVEIGYRKYPMRITLTGDWSLDIPGHFQSKWNDDGFTWSATDGPRTVWFRSMAVNGQSAGEALEAGRASLPQGDRIFARLHKPVLGEAVFGPHSEDGIPYHRLSGIASADGQLAACNVYLKDIRDKDWAIVTWQSLRQESRTR